MRPREIAPNHHLGEPGPARPGDRRATGHAAIPQHHHFVADLQDFGQFVGDEDDALPLCAQAAKNRQQIGDFSRREVRGRLIEDQEFGVAQDCLEDLDALPAAQRQRGDERGGVEVETETPACFPHLRRDGGGSDNAPRLLPAEHHVLDHRHRLDQHEVLVNHRDAGRHRLAGMVTGKFSAAEDDRAGIGRHHSEKHFHQRAFARTVLAEQTEDLTRLHVEIDPVVGPQCAERAHNAPHFQERGHGLGRIGRDMNLRARRCPQIYAIVPSRALRLFASPGVVRASALAPRIAARRRVAIRAECRAFA